MKINKLNEDYDKNGKLICYGGKSYSGKHTLVFGAFKNGRYTVSLLSNAGVRGGSQVCFKTIEEFNEFKNRYGDESLELVTRHLDSSEEPLVKVPTDYGELWMKQSWYNFVPMLDARQTNKLIKSTLDTVCKELNIDYYKYDTKKNNISTYLDLTYQKY